MHPGGKAALVLGVLAALTALEAKQLGNPAPAPADAPAAQFSATRAIATQHAVSIDAPHAIATPSHDGVRDNIAAALRALDYQVDIEHRFACNAYAQCSPVDNLIARRPEDAAAAAGRKHVALVAHYDSVPGGPGASDDGTGVATVLEIARIVRHETFANPVVFLIDDGEEGGLLGAEGYVADDARSHDTAFVVNLEARGTTGTPFLFETSRHQRWLIPIVASALPHPISTSLFATIYDQLPNDTDLTVFKRADRAGINFAYVGGKVYYHTPLDDFAHIDAGTVQRRGDQTLAMVRAFAQAPLAEATPGAAVWFDVFATVLVWWPTGWSLPIALAAIALVIAAVALGRRRGAITLGGVALGAVSLVATLIIAGVAGDILTKLLAIHVDGELYPPHAGAMLGAAWAVGLAAALAAVALVRRWASFDAVVAGHALIWLVLGIVVDVVLPGAAYAPLVPGAVLAVALVARQVAKLPAAVVAVAGLAGASAVLLPFALFGYDALGTPIITAVALLLGLIGSTAAPLVAATRRDGDIVERGAAGATALVGLIATVALAIVALRAPTESAIEPAQAAISHVTNADTGAARWQGNQLTPAVLGLAAFKTEVVSPWWGDYGTADVAPAPAIAIAGPTATVAPGQVQADGTRTITLDLASPRGAARMALAWKSDAELVQITVNGVPMPPRPPRFHQHFATGWHRLVIWTAAAKVEIKVRGAAPAEALLTDTSFGLPALGAPLAAVRDATGAVTFQDGDTTVVEHHLAW